MMSDKEFQDFTDKYNIKYQGQTWGKQGENTNDTTKES